MWLLNTTTYELRELPAAEPGSYAILSHRWEDKEVTFQDLQERSRLSGLDRAVWRPSEIKKRSWEKIQRACAEAWRRGYKEIWQDMCCIDKTSSPELQEALNSMFALYRDAGICLAYLKDVHDPEEDHALPGSSFRRSVWFTRGWTLQELIAPSSSMIFLSSCWTPFGTRGELSGVISEITNIDSRLLSSPLDAPRRLDLSRWSIAARMSWAAKRETTRAEDRAYSLAGLFDVSMPIIYGEGGEKAFWRLQLEIIRQSPDQSIFAWASQLKLRHISFSSSGDSYPDGSGDQSFSTFTRRRNLLASHPQDFLGCDDVNPVAYTRALTDALGLSTSSDGSDFSITNRGIRMHLPLHTTGAPGIACAALTCRDASGDWVGLVLLQIDGNNTYVCVERESSQGPVQARVLDTGPRRTPFKDSSLSAVSPAHQWKMSTIYIQAQATVRSKLEQSSLRDPYQARGLEDRPDIASPHNTRKDDVYGLSFGGKASLDFDDDVYTRAWTAVAKLRGEDLKKVPYVTIEDTLGLVSAALGILATKLPVFEPVRAAANLTTTLIAPKNIHSGNIRNRIVHLHLMQADLLCFLFGLRCLNWEDVVGDEMLLGRLETLRNHITSDVKRLGNVMEKYATESRLALILSREYGFMKAITKCWKIVEARKKEIMDMISWYTSRRADQIAASVDRALVKCQALRDLFTPEQNEVKAFHEVVDLDYFEECLKIDYSLNDLAGVILSDTYFGEHSPDSESSPDKTKLTAADHRRIRTPVEKILGRKLQQLDSKIAYLLDKAKRERTTMMKLTEQSVGRPYDHIRNPDIKKLWEEMGWGDSIDSHTFVQSLYDYFIDLERESRVVSRSAALSTGLTNTFDIIPRALPPDPSNAGKNKQDEFEGCTTPEAAAQDAWCLNYFNYRTFPTFMEVLDGDMNGLVNIKTVNEFTSAKSDGITLMQWVVYSAYGWLVSAHIYRLRIEWMVQRIVALDCAKENSAAVTAYMDLIQWVTAFLRTLGEPDLDDQQLLKVIHIVMEKQEKSVKVVLEMLNYELEEKGIRTMMDLSIHGGPGTIGRIEERMLPVIHLVMQRHYAILSLASEYVLEENALERATRTIDYITDLLYNRTVHLRESFLQLQHDVDRKIQYFANGMFQGVHHFLSATNLDARLRLMDSWYLPWKSEQWLAWALQEYDPEFPLDVPSILSTSLSPSQRDLVRVVRRALSGEPDEGYELVASYRKHYGIMLASSLQVGEEPADTPIQQDDAGESEAAQPVQHIMAQCDGCMVDPIAGLRFKCIDCRDFDYCSTCHGKLPPPLMHPNAIAGDHTEAHRFLRVEKDVPTEHMNAVLGNLRATPLSDTPGQLIELDPLIVHCLSEPDDVVQGVVQALVAYRTHCLQANIDEEASGLADLEALDAALGTFASLPLVAEFAKSRMHHLLRIRDGIPTIHPGVYCGGGNKCANDGKIYGDQYKCIDCTDFDFCAQCHAAHCDEHHRGEHRFIILRFPTPRTVIVRLIAYVRGLSGDGADLWKIEERDWDTRAAAGESESDMGAGDGSPPVSPREPAQVTALWCCGPCERAISGRWVYRCLSCLSAGRCDIQDSLLCAECAYAETPTHRSNHVLAVVPRSTLTGSWAAQVDAHLRGLQEVSNAVTNEDLSKRMDKIEETMATLLSMVGRLQPEEAISTSGAVRQK